MNSFIPNHSWTNTSVKYTRNGLLEVIHILEMKLKKLKDSNSVSYYLIKYKEAYILINRNRTNNNRREGNYAAVCFIH